MGRPVVLSNGQLFVGLNENGLVHDFYYPYVGLENLTNARSVQHKIGVWVDGNFKWTDDGSWQISLDFETDALISEVSMYSQELELLLKLQDYIDKDANSFIRHITITNQSNTERDIRLFMHQIFQLSNEGRADTAIYVPDEHYILDYKGRYCMLVGGRFSDGQDFDQYAVGNYGIEGKAGTFLDAEDGELSGNAVEHGGVDSVIRFKRNLRGGDSATVDYWIVAASNQRDAETVHRQYTHQDMQERLRHTRQQWQQWIGGGEIKIPEFHKRSLQHSLLIAKAHCDDRGAVLASGDSSIFNYGRDYYCYCWPRDAVYVLWPLIRLGHFEEAKQFLHFARDTMHDDGYLMHKYQPDRAIGSTWHPLVHEQRKELAIQEDETACVIFLIGELLEASKDKDFAHSLYSSLVVPAANFMTNFVDKETGLPHASYDLWEEKFLTTSYTVCTVIAGLETASKLADLFEFPDDSLKWKKAASDIKDNLDKLVHPDGYFVKGFLLQPDGSLKYDNTVDISSLYGPYMYAGLPLNDERLLTTVKYVEERILNTSPAGGVIRYEDDNYFRTKPEYKGNPWAVGTLWLAQYYSTAGRDEDARNLLQWALDKELPSGVLSEQFDPETSAPLGVTPLVWSHAELVNTLLDLAPKK